MAGSYYSPLIIRNSNFIQGSNSTVYFPASFAGRTGHMMWIWSTATEMWFQACWGISGKLWTTTDVGLSLFHCFFLIPPAWCYGCFKWSLPIILQTWGDTAGTQGSWPQYSWATLSALLVLMWWKHYILFWLHAAKYIS